MTSRETFYQKFYWHHHVLSDTEKCSESAKSKYSIFMMILSRTTALQKSLQRYKKLVKLFWKESLAPIYAKWESALNRANHGLSPQKILISAQNYKISLMNSLIRIARMLFGVWISPASVWQFIFKEKDFLR